ncbi:MAG: alpha-amylase [Pirellulales bacterium]|nr:alpha-amylase [Pirellulales bacterium]
MRQAVVTRITVSSIAGLVVWLCAAPVNAVPALQDVVMYEINLRAFSQAGDLAGVTARLDEIQSLGANVLWLMPIHPIGQERTVGQLGSPYSVRDYSVVSSEYGALSDLSSLVDAAHDRGMFVLMDWVANHTAWDHGWMANADWYTQNPQGEIIHPPGTNWLDVADLNYSSTAMRSAMISEMQHWISNVGIDGFRADAADFVPFDFWQQAIPAVRGATQRPLLMLAEGARSDHYDAGFDLTFDWSFYNTVKSVFNSSNSATALGTSHTAAYSHVPEGKSILRFTTNHDESAWDATPVELFGGLDASLAAYAVTVAYGATPLVYASQEIGWSQNVPIFSKSPLDWTTGQDTAEWYAELLSIREDHIALRQGTLTDQSNSDVAMLMRENDGDQVLIIVNTRDQLSQIQVPAAWQGGWFNQFTGDAELLTPMHMLDAYQVLILAAAPPSQSGDFDGDGDVDGLDFLKWQRGESPNPMTSADLNDWQTNFGPGSLVAAGQAVGEPASGLLALAATAAIALLRNRRHDGLILNIS